MRTTYTASPRRAVPAAAGAVGVLRAPGVDHRHDVTERASAVLALVGTALAAVVCNMLATARTVRMLGTPGVQQRAQRMVLRAAIDAEVFAALTALEQRVLAAAGSTWMLRAPAIQQRTRIARWRSTVLAVFTHVAYYSIISGLCGKQLFYPLSIARVNASSGSVYLFKGRILAFIG